jgi:hypothetical protein
VARFDGSTDAPSLRLEVDPSSLTDFTLDLSTLGGTAPLGPNPAWTALPITDVRTIATRRGRPRADQPSDAGTMTVEFDNLSGFYDPDNTSVSNPYAVGGVSWFRAGLPARLIATWNSIDYPLFKGTMEDPIADLSASPMATFTFADGIAAASADLTGFNVHVETTGQRANRVLDLMGWPTADRNIIGSKGLLALGDAISATAVLEQCAAAEAGRFYVDASGVMRLCDLADALNRTVKMTLADDDSSGSVDYETLATSPGVKYIVNVATVDNGTYSSTVTNTQSIAKTRIRRAVNRTVPLSSNTDIDNLATYLATHLSTATTRVEQVEIEALGIGAAWPGLLSTDLADRVRTKRTGVNGMGLDVTLTVEGLDHTITVGSWRVALSTAPIDTTGSAFTLGTSLLNGSDVLAA